MFFVTYGFNNHEERLVLWTQSLVSVFFMFFRSFLISILNTFNFLYRQHFVSFLRFLHGLMDGTSCLSFIFSD